MAFVPVREKEYSSMYTDTKLTAVDNDPVDEGATLVEVQADGSLKGYLFVQNGWRLVGDL